MQGTVNGVGERTGNANLVTVVATLGLKGDRLFAPARAPRVNCAKNLGQLTAASRFVDEALNLAPRPGQPYVGASAFAHKGGRPPGPPP